MHFFRRHRKVFTVIIAIATIALILTSILPVLYTL